MKLMLALLVALTVAYVVIRNVASAGNYGVDVADRFVERLAYIPSKTQSLLTRGNLENWLADPEHSVAGKSYGTPVLFPLDLIFLLLLGCFLGVASTAVVGEVPMLGAVPRAIFWILPLLFLLCDLS